MNNKEQVILKIKSLSICRMLVSASIFLVIIVGFGCDENGIDPCTDMEPVTAKFSISELVTNHGGVDTLIVSDTVLTYNTIEFSSSEIHRSYEWTIGNDRRKFSGPKVELFFEYPENNVRVQLIVKKTPNLDCFPQDDGIDTLVQYLTVIDRKENPIKGDYIGYLKSNPNDTFLISVVLTDLNGFQIKNINRTCDPTQFTLGLHTRVAYKLLNFSNSEGTEYYRDGCQDPEGWFIMNKNNKDIIVNFSTGAGDKFFPRPKDRTYDQFIGVKLK